MARSQETFGKKGKRKEETEEKYRIIADYKIQEKCP